MTDFDRRWQECAARARESQAEPSAAPSGLATRAWAQYLAQADAAPSAMWPALSFRALVLATIVLLACLSTEYFAAASDDVFAPHLEDVATSVWGIP